MPGVRGPSADRGRVVRRGGIQPPVRCSRAHRDAVSADHHHEVFPVAHQRSVLSSGAADAREAQRGAARRSRRAHRPGSRRSEAPAARPSPRRGCPRQSRKLFVTAATRPLTAIATSSPASAAPVTRPVTNAGTLVEAGENAANPLRKSSSTREVRPCTGRNGTDTLADQPRRWAQRRILHRSRRPERAAGGAPPRRRAGARSRRTTARPDCRCRS